MAARPGRGPGPEALPGQALRRDDDKRRVPAVDIALSRLRDEVKGAAAQQRTLRIRGGNTRAFYGNPWPESVDADWLDVSGYRGIVSYEPSELVLTARAGTPLAEIEAALDERRQMLAFEPPRFGAAGTIGGAIATGLSGPRRMAAGRAADFVLGTRLLNARGEVLRFGGEVMKNVAGYDVSRLLAGSLGVLGVLVEVSIKVVPIPRCEATLVLAADEAGALRQCLAWRSKPVPVSGTAWMGGDDSSGRLAVRISGNESALREARAKIGGEKMAAPDATAFWTSLRDQTHAFFTARPLWRIALPPKAPPLGLGPTLIEWGGGLRWVKGIHDAAALRSRIEAMGGTATLYRRDGAAATVPTFHPLQDAVMQIHRRLKHEFDPAGIFNRGRLLPGS